MNPGPPRTRVAGPLTDDEKRRLAIAREAPRPLPADPVEEPVADLRRIEKENPNNPRRL